MFSSSSSSSLFYVDSKSYIIIRERADLISVYLRDLFNKSLLSQVYFLTIGNVLGLLRCLSKVKASDLNNYRPISVIFVMAKVFERIVCDQLYNFLSDEDIISTHQSGFRSSHSTLTVLLEATDNWPFNIDRSNVNAVVFLYLKKAFDTVDHDILYLK